MTSVNAIFITNILYTLLKGTQEVVIIVNCDWWQEKLIKIGFSSPKQLSPRQSISDLTI